MGESFIFGCLGSVPDLTPTAHTGCAWNWREAKSGILCQLKQTAFGKISRAMGKDDSYA
jgi:hypothetical protein